MLKDIVIQYWAIFIFNHLQILLGLKDNEYRFAIPFKLKDYF